jgi:hypothetical protein
MKCNVGGWDKTFRLIVGILALGIGIFAPVAPIWHVVAYVVAGIAFLTALIGFCPLNALLGIDTCARKQR